MLVCPCFSARPPGKYSYTLLEGQARRRVVSSPFFERENVLPDSRLFQGALNFLDGGIKRVYVHCKGLMLMLMLMPGAVAAIGTAADK